VADLLVLGGALLPSATEELRSGWGLRIEDGRVAEIGANESLQAAHPRAEAVDARRLLLMPGLVDAHTHAYGVLAHGLAPASPPCGFYEFLADFWWPQVEDRLDQAMIEAAMALWCARAIRGGVTAFCDVLEAPNAAPGILDDEADVVRLAGLRAILMIEASERVDRARGESLLAENVRFVEATARDPLVGGMLCLHTSFTCSEELVVRARDTRVDLDCAVHLHLSESAYEPTVCLDRRGVRPTEWYERLGLWDGRALASQVVSVDEGELRLLAARGVRTVHMPLSNCEVGGGVSPVPAMLDLGMRPALGTDGYIENLFEVMRGAFLIHKGVRENPSVMPASVVLRMATEWGADAIGVPESGVLDVGRAADLIGVALDFDTPLRTANAAEQLVLRRNPEHVELSIVGGRILMRDGRLLTVDEDAARAEVRRQAERLWGED
jgi:5-methylthioadenosine/S-adenosylhomocysteine deaminase